MTTSVVMLAGIAVSQVTRSAPAALGAANTWLSASTDCSVTQVPLTPSLLYSAEAQGYVVAAITFDEVPPGCVRLDYHLALVAADGAQVFEVTAVMGEANHQVSIPDADRPRADAVATTVLSIAPEIGALLDGHSA